MSSLFNLPKINTSAFGHAVFTMLLTTNSSTIWFLSPVRTCWWTLSTICQSYRISEHAHVPKNPVKTQKLTFLAANFFLPKMAPSSIISQWKTTKFACLGRTWPWLELIWTVGLNGRIAMGCHFPSQKRPLRPDQIHVGCVPVQRLGPSVWTVKLTQLHVRTVHQ